MTVQVTDRLSLLYVGNGVNTQYSFEFRAFNQQDKTGVAVRIKNGTEWYFMDENLYAVTMNPDNEGGFVTFVTPPEDGVFFHITGATPVDQHVDITNYDNFYPDVIERGLDKLTAILQERQGELSFEEQSRILADIEYDNLAQQREADLKAYIDGVASTIYGQPVVGVPSHHVSHGPITQKKYNDGVESIAELLAISNPQDGMRMHVNSYNPPNYALLKPYDGGGGDFVYKSSKSGVNDDGLIINGWVRQNYSVLKPEFWGADPHNQVDCSAAFNKMFIAAKGRSIELDGHYKFTSPIVVDYENAGTLKMYGQGSGIHDGQNGIQRTVLDFDSLPAESVAITFKRIRGLKLSDFHVTHSTLFDDSSTTCWITALDDFEIERVTLKNTNGASSTGFRFGLTDGNDCAFMGTVKNCEINMLRGRATSIMPACTSINHINCYQQGGYFYSYKSQYCKYDNCASEGSPSFGYIAEDTKSLTYISCAGEANALGVFTVKRGCSNIEYISPYGAANQGAFGALLLIDGSVGYNASIKVSNPVSIMNPNARFDIYSDGVNGILEVNNIYQPNLPHGIGGSATWKQNCLIMTGDNVIDDTFTATLNNFVAATQPTATAIYTRSGRKVEIVIKVIPSVSTTTDATSTITIPTFGGIRLDSVASVVGQNNVNYGNCMVYTNGTIQMPVIGGGFSVPIFIRATLITDHAVA